MRHKIRRVKKEGLLIQLFQNRLKGPASQRQKSRSGSDPDGCLVDAQTSVCVVSVLTMEPFFCFEDFGRWCTRRKRIPVPYYIWLQKANVSVHI